MQAFQFKSYLPPRIGLLSGRVRRTLAGRVSLNVAGGLGNYCRYKLAKVTDNCVGLEITEESHSSVKEWDPLEVILRSSHEGNSYFYEGELRVNGHTLVLKSYNAPKRWDFLKFREESNEGTEMWTKILDAGTAHSVEIKIKNQRVHFKDPAGEGFLYLPNSPGGQLSWVVNEHEYFKNALTECFYKVDTKMKLTSTKMIKERLIMFLHMQVSSFVTALKAWEQFKGDPNRVDHPFVHQGFEKMSWIHCEILYVLGQAEVDITHNKDNQVTPYKNANTELVNRFILRASELAENTEYSLEEKVNFLLTEHYALLRLSEEEIFIGANHFIKTDECLTKVFERSKTVLKTSLDEMHVRQDKTIVLTGKGMVWRGSLEFVDNVLNNLRVKLIEDAVPRVKCLEIKKHKKIVEHMGCTLVLHYGGYKIKFHKDNITWQKEDGTGPEGIVAVDGDSFDLHHCGSNVVLRITYDSTQSSKLYLVSLHELLSTGKLSLNEIWHLKGFDLDSDMHMDHKCICIVTQCINQVHGKVFFLGKDADISSQFTFDAAKIFGMSSAEFLELSNPEDDESSDDEESTAAVTTDLRVFVSRGKLLIQLLDYVSNDQAIEHRLVLLKILPTKLQQLNQFDFAYQKAAVHGDKSSPLSVDTFDYAKSTYVILMNRELHYKLIRVKQTSAETVVNWHADKSLLRGLRFEVAGGEIEDSIDVRHNRLIFAVPEVDSHLLTLLTAKINN